jgi:hypothetical protein
MQPHGLPIVEFRRPPYRSLAAGLRSASWGVPGAAQQPLPPFLLPLRGNQQVREGRRSATEVRCQGAAEAEAITRGRQESSRVRRGTGGYWFGASNEPSKNHEVISEAFMMTSCLGISTHPPAVGNTRRLRGAASPEG